MTEWNLLEKTELRIEHIGLIGANLDDVAKVVAAELCISVSEVLVIDARDDVLALDILRRTIDANHILGKERSLLTALASVQGVQVTPDSTICAQGMLGWIMGNASTRILRRSEQMSAQIEQQIRSRAIAFSTGAEVCDGQIVDTNKPWIMARLKKAGFEVTAGDNLRDDVTEIEAALREAGEERGFGLIVTTGGVGAESKDGTVEALLRLDPTAATPHIFDVVLGQGRHVKAQVRIGVGVVGTALVVCLPGPHPEATAGTETLAQILPSSRDPAIVAGAIVAMLRERLQAHHA